LDHVDWPKKRVEELCEERGRRFAPHVDALKIIRMARREKLRDEPCYAEFEDKLEELCPKAPPRRSGVATTGATPRPAPQRAGRRSR
jgi:hypothetical protein